MRLAYPAIKPANAPRIWLESPPAIVLMQDVLPPTSHILLKLPPEIVFPRPKSLTLIVLESPPPIVCPAPLHIVLLVPEEITLEAAEHIKLEYPAPIIAFSPWVITLH